MTRTIMGALFLGALAGPAFADAGVDLELCKQEKIISCSCGTAPCHPENNISIPKQPWDTGNLWINGAIDYGFELGPIVQRMLKADMEKENSK